MSYTLDELCHIEKGKIGITKAIDGEYPLVTTGEDFGTHNEYHFEGPAVCVPLVSSTGHGHASIKRLHYVEGKFACGNILAVLIPKDPSKLSAKFLYTYLTVHKQEKLVRKMKGAANVSLTLTNLKKVKVDNLPQIFEQKQFANKFEKLNTIKEKLNILIDKNIEHNSFLPKRISEIMFYLSDYGCEEKSLPNGWKWSPLSKLGSTGTGTTPSTSNDLFYGGDIPFIKPGDMFDGEIDYFNQSLTNEGLANGRSVAKNSILMVCIGGSIGKSAIVDRQVSCNQQINYIQPEINNKFLLYVMKTPYFQRQLRLKAKGTSTPIINKTNWESILIPIPTNDEILKISHNLSFIYNNQAKIMIAMQKIKKIIRNLDKSFFQYV